jgi:F-type H+-transporting ATPase subunit epsilon
MRKTIKFKIVTPERVVYEDNIFSATIPTRSGEITILPDHTPLVTLMKTGEIRLHKPNVKETVALSVTSGVVEIRESSPKNNSQSEVVILTSRSELANDIDLERAKKAYEEAQKLADKNKKLNDVDFARFEALIEKEANRIKVYNKWNK